MYRGKQVEINLFNGGYAGHIPPNQLAPSQAFDLQNIVLKPGGQGFRSRYGVTQLCSLTTGPTQGLGYLLQANQTEWLFAISGTKAYKITTGGTATDITGAYGGITSNQSYLWNFFTFNDAIIGFGGSPTSPDAPITWSGSGNIAALGGTSPSAYGGFTVNNRAFAFRTSANPSTIYWSIIGTANDFGGTGSGSAVVGSFSDNQRITAAAILNNNYVLVFKENSIHQMVVTSAPFATFPLFDKVGCAGKHALCDVDGEIFFVTNQKQMYSTDGTRLKQYPFIAGDLWNAITDPTVLVGYRRQGSDFDHLVWVNPNSATSIVWDLINQCWLKDVTFVDYSVVATDKNNQNYLALSNTTPSKIYKNEQSTTYLLSEESTPLWQSGWLSLTSGDSVLQINRMVIHFKKQTVVSATNLLQVGYRLNYSTGSFTSTNIDVSAISGSYASVPIRFAGRGNVVQFKIYNPGDTPIEISKVTLYGKVYGQKSSEVS